MAALDDVTIARLHAGRITKKERRIQRRRLKAIQRIEDEVAQQLAAEGVEIVQPGDHGESLTHESPQQKEKLAKKEGPTRRQNKRGRANRDRKLASLTQENSRSGIAQTSQ